MYFIQHCFIIHCVGWCWDRTQDSCDFGIGCQTLTSHRLHLVQYLMASTRTLHLNTVRDWRCRVLLRVVFFSAEWFGTEFLEFFYFSFTERNSELFSLPIKGSEGNSEILLLFLFTEQNSELVSLPLKRFGRELWKFASIFSTRTERNSELFSLPRNGSEFSVPRNSRNSTGTNQCSVFRRIIFGRKLPTLVQRPLMAELVNP
jgi:hypothetical protein